MAYLFTNSSSQYFIGNSAPVGDEIVTIAAWCRPTSGNMGVVASIGRDTASDRFQINVTTTQMQATRVQSGGALTTAVMNATISNGAWIHVAATFDVSGGNMTAWLNGVPGTSVTNPGGALTLNRMLIGARLNSGSPGAYANGDIAEVGVWNAALTADEIAGLAKGYKCSDIRPQSLRFDFRMIRDLQELSGGIVMTNTNGATVSNHPRIIFP